MLKTDFVKINSLRAHFISDIHGELNLLKRLLQNIDYHHEDALFINGDLCEKGPDSLGVVRYVMDLASTSKSVYVTMGNNDALVEHLINHNEHLLRYLEKRPHSIFHEMLKERSLTLADFQSIQDLSAFLLKHYASELSWLAELPHAFETEDYIIVHAGIEDGVDWRETTIHQAYAFASFYDKRHQQEKTVIVGHWPISNYTSKTKSHNNPIIDKEKRIICIDGGNQLKETGQLNALTIQAGTFTTSFVDNYTKKRLVTASFANVDQMLGIVCWPHYELDILKETEHFTYCTNRTLSIEQWVKNEYIYTLEERSFCKEDISTTLLDVEKGDIVFIMDETCSGYDLVKRDGEFGWIPKGITQKM